MVQFMGFYPDGWLGYNVHGLLHIVEDVKLYGTVDSFSAYNFENKIQLIGNLIRKPNHVLAQLFNRLHEIKYSEVKVAPRKYNPLNIKKGDSCLLGDYKTYVIVVEKPISSSIEVQSYTGTTDFFTKPIPSSEMLIVESVRDTSGAYLGGKHSIELSSIVRKCYTLPLM